MPGVSLRSQEFADGENDLKDLGNYELKNMLSGDQAKNYAEINSAGLVNSNCKPLNLGLQAMRRNSQDIKQVPNS